MRHAPERQSADGAKLLFELTGEITVECHMSGVVGTWRQLVDQQRSILANEELDAENTNNFQLFENRPRDLNRLVSDSPWNASGRNGDGEIPVRMVVLNRCLFG